MRIYVKKKVYENLDLIFLFDVLFVRGFFEFEKLSRNQTQVYAIPYCCATTCANRVDFYLSLSCDISPVF
jgi:hypothetical protein